MKHLLIFVFFLTSFITNGQSLKDSIVNIDCCKRGSMPKIVVKMNEIEYVADSILEALKSNWVEKLEVLKSKKQKKIYGNNNGVILIYPKEKYFLQIHMLLEVNRKLIK